MMRLEETAAVRAATTTEEFDDGAVMMRRHLQSDADDPRQSPEGETLKAVQRICQKLESGGKPRKFPPPAFSARTPLPCPTDDASADPS
jgi:hypothetical protein